MSTTTESGAAAWSQLLQDLREAYDAYPLPTARYILLAVVPSVVLSAAMILVALVAPLPMFVRAPISLAGLLLLITVAIFPKLWMDARRAEIENTFYLLTTHLTVLSTTNIDRMEVFRELATESEYGAAAEEIARLVQLVDTWNQSLDDALRRHAKEVPSESMAELFDRLGYTLSAGQQLDDFLLSEQAHILDQYTTIYESALANLEVMKDLYLSMILSMTFAIVFAVVLPILTGTDPTVIVAGVVVLFIFVQVGFLVAIRKLAPTDPVWYFPEETTDADRRLRAVFAGAWALTTGLIGIMLLGIIGWGPGLPGILFFVSDLPLPFYVAVPLTPLLIIGLTYRKAERDIVARDEDFPPFIRALGASESAKQSPTSVVLSTLRQKDFGTLSDAIDRLYRRLNIRIDPEAAWEAFAVDTRSYLIQKFSEMYIVGRQMGGEPKQLGELISTNMSTINRLREQRRQAAITLIGVLYGITAAAAFAFFMGIELVTILSDMSTTLAAGDFESQLVYPDAYDIPVIESLLLFMILTNAIISAMIIRTVDGGHMASGYFHFVLLTWVGCLSAMGTRWLVSGIITI